MIKKIAKRLSISQPGSAPKSSNAMKVASGMFRKKGSSVKNWKSRRYIITDDGMIYYFDPLCTSDAPSEANGELRVRYCEIVDGDENNIADSGSVDYSEEEGVAIDIKADRRVMETVFDSATDACLFFSGLKKVAVKSNIKEFLTAKMDKLPWSEILNSEMGRRLTTSQREGPEDSSSDFSMSASYDPDYGEDSMSPSQQSEDLMPLSSSLGSQSNFPTMSESSDTSNSRSSKPFNPDSQRDRTLSSPSLSIASKPEDEIEGTNLAKDSSIVGQQRGAEVDRDDGDEVDSFSGSSSTSSSAKIEFPSIDQWTQDPVASGSCAFQYLIQEPSRLLTLFWLLVLVKTLLNLNLLQIFRFLIISAGIIYGLRVLHQKKMELQSVSSNSSDCGSSSNKNKMD